MAYQIAFVYSFSRRDIVQLDCYLHHTVCFNLDMWIFQHSEQTL